VQNKMNIVCGVDEAGRGPVIGALVLCGVAIDEFKVPALVQLGVKDSKLLTPKRREMLYDEILKVIDSHKIIVVEPAEIDEALNSPHLNLNWLEAIKTAMILNELKPHKAIVDCPSNNIAAYSSYLGNLLKEKIDLLLEHNAERYPVVAAASIIAKVTRDRLIEDLKKMYGDFGSGYPSDPKTKTFLEKNHGKYPELFRTTWAPYKKFQQSTLDEFS